MAASYKDYSFGEARRNKWKTVLQTAAGLRVACEVWSWGIDSIPLPFAKTVVEEARLEVSSEWEVARVRPVPGALASFLPG